MSSIRCESADQVAWRGLGETGLAGCQGGKVVRGVVGVPMPVVLMVPVIMVMVISMLTMVAMSLMSGSMIVVLTMRMI